jgi:hypothetical protein
MAKKITWMQAAEIMESYCSMRFVTIASSTRRIKSSGSCGQESSTDTVAEIIQDPNVIYD